jgi:hypothetical protein
MKEGDTETPKAETPADTELADQTLTAAVYTDASMATPDESAAATITVSGSMPKDAYVKAYPVEVAIDEVNVLAAFDITVYAADGTVFEPAEDAPLSVKIDAPVLADVDTVDIYHVEDKDAAAADAAAAPVDASVTKTFAPAEGESAPTQTVETMSATLVDKLSVSPDAPSAEFQAKGFSIYVLAGDATAVNNSKLSLSTNYIKMDVSNQERVGMFR